jgi:hypothetical protein
MAEVAPGKGWSLGREFVPRRSCIICGTKFYAPPAQIKRGPNSGKFCSTKCSSSRQIVPKQRRMGFSGKSVKLRYCRTCGGMLVVPGTNYCSHACFGKQCRKEGTYVQRKCASCGNEFTAYAGAKPGQEIYCSQRCSGREAVHLKATFSRGRGGKRADLEGQYFRSRWEANWARYLNWMKARGEITGWEYETETFEFSKIKRGSRFYTPDFKVTENSGAIIYHELKGWLDKKSITKLKRMKKYHPSVEVLLVQKREYDAVRKQLHSIIPGWE